MEKIILVATADSDQAEIIERILTTSLPDDSAILQFAASESEAHRRLSSNLKYDLVISAADLPEHKNTPINVGENRGARLLPFLRKRNKLLPVILVSGAIDSQLNSTLLRYDQVLPVTTGVDFPQLLEAAVKRLMEKTAPPPRRYVRVVFTADAERTDSWTFEILGEGFLFAASGSLTINSKKIEEFIFASKIVAELPKSWQQQLRRLGEALFDEIFSNAKFSAAYYAALSRIDDKVQQLKIWFRIGKALQPIILEALVSNDPYEEFWMLQAPIYRRLVEYPCTQTPLFSCGSDLSTGRLRCLLIESDATGLIPGMKNAEGNDLELKKLRHIHGECEKIYSILQENPLVGELRWVQGSNATSKSFAEYVMDILLSQSWDLVHYAGHSHFEGDRGFLFFPPKELGDFPEKLRIGNFAANLVPHTKLLYLSSCQSSEDSFVMALARSKIPAAVGFRWRVDDAHASEYALSFYRHLFGDDEKCLQHAIVRARKDMYEHGLEQERIWVSPMLLMQAS
jgi:CheY-like chemotaxis protein